MHRHLVTDLEHAATVLFLKLVIVDLVPIVVDPDPTSLGLCLPSAPLLDAATVLW
jgi:hypothetical protein